MNYIFCDKKCYAELKEIDTLLDAKCSDICKVITRLDEEKQNCENSISTGEGVGLIIGVVLTAVTAYVLVHVHVALGVGSIILLGPILAGVCGLIGGKVDKTGAQRESAKLEAID